MTLVSQPRLPHRCEPNDYGAWLEHPNDQPGTVRACDECGKTWVAFRVQYRPGMRGHQLGGSLWRREGRFERWSRERRARRAAKVSMEEVEGGR